MAAFGAQMGQLVVSLAANYLVSRFTARDGPRLDNLAAAGGDYGVPMARGFGTAVRVTGAFIVQDDIVEHEHEIEDYSEIVGAIGGAVQGFMLGGPVGAVIGGAIGGLLGFAAPDQKYYTYTQTAALLLLDRRGDDPVEGVGKIWAGGKVIFTGSSGVESQTIGTDGKLVRKKYRKNKYMKSLTVYTGHVEQDVDPILAQVVDEDSGYILRHFIVIEDLELGPFGQTFPACEALSMVKANQSAASVCEMIAKFANIDPQLNLSTTALAEDTLQGYLIDVETTCWDALKPLMPVFRSDAAEVSGQIRFYKRSQHMRATIRPTEMGAHAYGEEPPPRYKFRREGDIGLPRKTSLTFIDPDRDYQPNTMSSTRSEGDSSSNIAVNLKIVLDANEGAEVAALIHWDAWLGRTELSFTLKDNWLSLATGYAYGLPIDNEVIPYRIQRRTYGVNGIIECEAISDESVTYSPIAMGTSGTPPPVDEDTDFADTRLILMDMPITEDAHDDYGHYIVMGGSAADWPRGSIQASSDGTLFVKLIDQPFGAVMGDVIGTLGAGSTTGLNDELDTETVLTVETLHDGMTFSDATDSELDAWNNFLYVGKNGQGEYLQFKTATKIAPKRWELTNLRRGRKGTDHAIGTHTSGEEFAVLGKGGVYRLVYGNEYDWGNLLTWRGVTLNQDEDDAATQTFANSGEGKRPYSPANVQGSWDGSNNLIAQFESRSRLNAGGLGIDDRQEFEVQITNATPVRTMIVTVEQFSYSAAEQTADGLTPGTIVEGRVRQLSDVNDGRWRDFVIMHPDLYTADSDFLTADNNLGTADIA